jgi:hypothetical protein
MIAQNLKEYELIRQDMSSLKTRLSSHLSILLGGSGIAFYSISSISSSSPSIYLSIIFAFVASLIAAFFYLALYKYNSYNRFAGYCKLLNEEIQITFLQRNVQKEIKEIDTISKYNFIFWELCMAKYANYKDIVSFDESMWTQQLQYEGISMKNIKTQFYYLNGHDAPADNHSFLRGLKLIYRFAFNKESAKSWKYPIYTAYTYLILIIFYFLNAINKMIAHIDILKEPISEKINYDNEFGSRGLLFYYFIFSFLAFIIIVVIIKAFTELTKLMEGSKTPSAYCWKFLQHRIAFLNELGFKPKYIMSEEVLTDRVANKSTELTWVKYRVSPSTTHLFGFSICTFLLIVSALFFLRDNPIHINQSLKPFSEIFKRGNIIYIYTMLLMFPFIIIFSRKLTKSFQHQLGALKYYEDAFAIWDESNLKIIAKLYKEQVFEIKIERVENNAYQITLYFKPFSQGKEKGKLSIQFKNLADVEPFFEKFLHKLQLEH